MPATGPTAWNSPDFFVGKTILSAYEPYHVVSNTAYSSESPASNFFVWWNQPVPVAVKNIVYAASMNAVAASASSVASSGSEAYSYAYSANLYQRQDYSANSSNLSWINSASFGLTATLSYTSTAQTFGMSWVTDSTGGTAAFTTTSNAANWSSFATGAKSISVPFVTTLPPGEYWLAFQHSSSTATSNSNITLLSFSQLHQVWPQGSMGSLGDSVGNVSQGFQGLYGSASAITTGAGSTMPASVISTVGPHLKWFVFSGV